MERKADRACKTEKDIFASRLREAMRMCGLNQTSLSAKILDDAGVKLQRQTISLYMNGQSKPDTERLTLLCHALDVSADYLLGISDNPTRDESIDGACRCTGLSVRTVVILQQWAEQVSCQSETEREVYKYYEPLERINDLFEGPEGLLFLMALDRVKNEVSKGVQQLNSADSTTDTLSGSLRDLKLSVYELAESARKLADRLYGFEAIEEQLDKAFLDMLLDEYEKCSRSIEEVENGEHQES